MNTQKLSNVSLKVFRSFLVRVGCVQDTSFRGRGGHERWTRKDLLRPIIIQTHIDPIPEHIVKNTLRNLKVTRNEFFGIISSI